MKYVMPIEDRKMVGVIRGLSQGAEQRETCAFYDGGSTLGRRISDILQYRVRDLRGKDRIAIVEQKTGRQSYCPSTHIYKKYTGIFSRERRTMNLRSATAGASRTRRFPEYGYGRF